MLAWSVEPPAASAGPAGPAGDPSTGGDTPTSTAVSMGAAAIIGGPACSSAATPIMGAPPAAPAMSGETGEKAAVDGSGPDGCMPAVVPDVDSGDWLTSRAGFDSSLSLVSSECWPGAVS